MCYGLGKYHFVLGSLTGGHMNKGSDETNHPDESKSSVGGNYDEQPANSNRWLEIDQSSRGWRNPRASTGFRGMQIGTKLRLRRAGDRSAIICEKPPRENSYGR